MSDSKPPSGLDSELESFRQQWLSDLRTRKADAPPQTPSAAPAGAHHGQPPPPPLPSSSTAAGTASVAAPSRRTASSPTRSRRPAPPLPQQVDTADAEDDYFKPQSFDDLPPPPSATGHTLDGSVRPAPAQVTPSSPSEGRLVSALDHYEEAMEKEAQGSMGDSLKLYRQAYRLDHRVDKRYREKHFPASSSTKPAQAAATTPSSTAAAQAPPPQAPSGKGEDAAAEPLSTPDLIASFAALTIEPLPPHVDGDPPPPCPIAALPSELLVHILADLAADDPAALATGAALACKRFAYLAATEQRLWRRVALGSRWGFAGMHYYWARAIEWEPLEEEDVVLGPDEARELLGDDDDDDSGLVHDLGTDGGTTALVITAEELRRRRARTQLRLTTSLVPSAAYPSWRDLFRGRPRIRFNGCYISTVNYVRTGQMSTNQATWGGAPVHIVTYYRYLRFFRDGSCISLLATDPPRDVVHHLTREALLQARERLDHHHHHYHHRDRDQAHVLPSSATFMRKALKGRWRLSASLRRPSPGRDVPHHHHQRAASAVDAAAVVTKDKPSEDAAAAAADADEFEGDVFVETEGLVGTKYTYKMDLALRSAGKGTRNNKLVWRGFWSYNKLTDDWAEFQLRNDKHYFFSRVRSYGIGE
ncbi:F-box domain-containing protein [Purpureocillium lilacinum]|uniref:F-box domain-containing protein n=1 Tax=Purpureocillium lilacinum TaxID=33203 RepID=A0A179GG60_PURLI|nr:F-box domain-containing protein [Purpureocillium lilacinum]